MADPLSIAASVVGLLTTAGRICSVLSNFIGAAADAPKSAQDALSAVDEVRSVLAMVEGLLATISNLSSRRKMLVRLDHIRITFTNCVLTLSELESLVCFQDGMMHRLRWAWGEKKVLRLLPRLESQKTSLSLMVTVLLCESEMKALETRERLNATIDQILLRDEALATRLQCLDGDSTVETASRRFYDHESILTDSSSTLPAGAAEPDADLPRPTSNSRMSWFSTSPARTREQPASLGSRRGFEAVLDKSNVYLKSRFNASDISLTSSAVLSHAWSLLSLNDISVTSVFQLHVPVTLRDINAFGSGLTFASLLAENDAAPHGSARMSSWLPSTQDPGTEKRKDRTQEGWIQAWKAARYYERLGIGRAVVQKSDDAGEPLAGMLKLVVVGDAITEKAAALNSYTAGALLKEDDYIPTVFGSGTVTFRIGDHCYGAQLLDTTGTEVYDHLRPLIYRQTDAFLVFTRVGTESTYRNAEKLWIPEIRQHCPGVPIIMAGITTNGNDDSSRESEPQDWHSAEMRTLTRSYHELLGRTLATKFGAVCYTECAIFDPDQLGGVFEKAILAAVEPLERKRRARSSRFRSSSFQFLRTVSVRETKVE